MRGKEVWFYCSWCRTEYHVTVKCNIDEWGRLVPVCAQCGTNLVRMVKKSA